MNVGKIDCIVKDFGVIKSRSLIVEGKSIRNAYFRYVQRSIGDDSEVEFSDPVLLMKATVELVKLGKLLYLCFTFATLTVSTVYIRLQFTSTALYS